jgi:hypothetical protein
MKMQTKKIAKILSANDTGESGAHQAGMLIPKNPEILGFFPRLDKDTKNPRRSLTFLDKDGYQWEFSFIYYNNKFYGGTRNEFRLTGMTRFLKENNLKQGDEVILSIDTNGQKGITYKRQHENKGPVVLKGTWKVIKI